MPYDVPWEGNRPSIEDLLVVQDWTEDVLLELVRRKTAESRWLEYKDGRWLDPKDSAGKPQDAAGNLRRQVAGFANAEGGVLIVGVSEDSPQPGAPGVATGLAPTANSRKGGLEQFARTALTEGVYPTLSPSPAIHSFEAPDGDEYLVVVARQVRHGLVSVRCGKHEVFPARFGASTIDLDPWAVRSILLGTRRQPEFCISGKEAPPTITVSRQKPQFHSRRFAANLALSLVNQSLLHAERVSWGLVSPMPIHGSTLTPTLSDAALTPVKRDIALCRDRDGRPSLVDPRGDPGHLQRCSRHSPPTIAPMGTAEMPLRFDFETRDQESFELWLAVYVVAKDSLPAWFRIELVVKDGKLVEYDISASDSPVTIGCWALPGE